MPVSWLPQRSFAPEHRFSQKQISYRMPGCHDERIYESDGPVSVQQCLQHGLINLLSVVPTVTELFLRMSNHSIELSIATYKPSTALSVVASGA